MVAVENLRHRAIHLYLFQHLLQLYPQHLRLEKLTTTSGKEIPIPTDVIATVADITFIGVTLDIYNDESIKSLKGKVIIPDGVTEIPETAFYSCTSLESIKIPDSVTSIGDNAFSDCTSLESVTIPDSITSIGARAFWTCSSLESVTIPEGVISIGDNAFYICTKLTSVTIPDSVMSIGEYAFSGCGYYDDTAHLTIAIPDNVTYIGENAFINVNNIKISEAQKKLPYYPWGALHVNDEEP